MLRAGARHPDANESPPSTSGSAPEPDVETDVQQLYATLNEYLLLEHKFQPRLCLPAESENGEVTTGARDGAAHVLRCLKVWFDLPTGVLIHAINLFDRFLTKMKVRPCHVPCITVACMNIAVAEHAERARRARAASVEELVSISQSTCTAGDVNRMSRVIVDKLALTNGCRPISTLDWALLLQAFVRQAAREIGGVEQLVGKLCARALETLVEVAACDAACADVRAPELALVLVYQQLEQELVEWSRSGATVPDEVYYLYDLAAQLQAHCHMSDAALAGARRRVRSARTRYEARQAAPSRQRLVWRLSERTLKVLRPTDRLTSLLPTIEEQHFAADSTPARKRSGSESSMSEDMSDWPRSPVLPVYCNN